MAKRASRNKSVKHFFKLFFDNTSIHACNFLSMNNITIYEKIFWGLVNIITVIVTILWIYQIWLWYVEDTIFINFDGTVPLQEVEHPGIAICNINKISKKRAYEFAEELSQLTNEGNITAILEDVKLIGNLYDFNLYGQERFRKVQEILNKYDNKRDYYDPTERIFRLITPCEEILQECSWQSKVYPCNELFFTRMTSDGFCCIFNYVRPIGRTWLYESRNLNIRPPTKPKMSQYGPGISRGLEVVLNNDVDDYFYTSLETTGFKIQMFLPKDFPDVLSGSLREILVGPGKHLSLRMEASVIQSRPQIKSLPVHMRKCLYESESHTSFGMYRQSDCFVDCKMNSMQALCNCIPFAMPIKPNSSKYRNICNLIDIPCVNQYSRKWSRYNPKDIKLDNLDAEREDSLDCDCLPTCDNVIYNIYTNYFSLEDTKRNITKISILSMRRYARLFKVDMTNTWFQVLSAFGGLMSLIMGWSLISIIEILVLFYKILLHYVYVTFNIKNN